MSKIHNVRGTSMNHAVNRERFGPVQLSACVLTARYRDLVAGPVIKRQAVEFFESREFEPWADMAHLDYEVVLRGYRNVLENGLPAGDLRRERYHR